jgi:hypothetical protein
MKKNQKCFIILPFSQTTDAHTEEYWTNHFNKFLKPLIHDKTKIVVDRSEPMRTGILQEIINNLIFSSIVIADITNLNPNVMWELGVRQSFSKGTIIIAEEETKIPFDLSIKGVIFYPKDGSLSSDHKKLTNFQVDLILAVKDCINHPEKPDSHIIETISGRGTIFEIVCQEETMRKLEAFSLELSFNKILMERVINQIEENKKAEKWSNLMSRPKNEACILLSTTRYLNENSSFYEAMNEYSADMEGLNAAMNEWSNKREIYEKFLLEQIPKYLNKIEQIEELFISAREKVEKIL